MTFEKWMKKVDAHILRIAGVTSADLPDWCWWDNWNDRIPPLEASTAFLENEGFSFWA